MRYGVIVCPSCRTPKIVDLSFKTTRCTRCGRVLHLDKLKILFKSDSQHFARLFIGKLNRDLQK